MTVDYLPIANGGAANVESQAAYVADLAPGGALQNGFQSGVAPSAKWNKTLRQSSMVSAAVANFIANALSINVLDDGNIATLITNLTNAITQVANSGAWSTGDVKLTMKVAADAGWVLCNDGSIGNAASGATTRANADTLALFTLLWTNVSNTWAPVSGGRGGSAAADFAANKRLTMSATLGRALAIAGAGAGLTARQMGQALGEETHLLLSSESGVPAHTHGLANVVGAGSAEPLNIGAGADAQLNSPGNTAANVAANAAAAHNIMQPTTFLNAMIKL